MGGPVIDGGRGDRRPHSGKGRAAGAAVILRSGRIAASGQKVERQSRERRSARSRRGRRQPRRRRRSRPGAGPRAGRPRRRPARRRRRPDRRRACAPAGAAAGRAGVGALPGVEGRLVGVGEVVQRHVDARVQLLGCLVGHERGQCALPAVLLGAEGQPPPADPAGAERRGRTGSGAASARDPCSTRTRRRGPCRATRRERRPGARQWARRTSALRRETHDPHRDHRRGTGRLRGRPGRRTARGRGHRHRAGRAGRGERPHRLRAVEDPHRRRRRP